jgi:SulP family sulfate permease
LIVAVMLIPQSLAYAMLAGLPPQVGLYASIAPLLAYALFGSSMTLSVGPVAVASLMTASALSPLATPGSQEYIALAMQLALLSGLMLVLFGCLRLGMLAHFLSHPVTSGFISGSAVIITLGQLKPLLGLQFAAANTPALLAGLVSHADAINPLAANLGLATIALLVFSRALLPKLLVGWGLRADRAGLIARLMPMLTVIFSTLLVARFDWHLTQGIAVVGAVPAGLPSLWAVTPDLPTLAALWLPALLIGVVGFVESVSVGQSLATQRKQRIDPDRELFGLGAANIASAACGGYAVAGGFSRSVVNFSAGAHTPLSGVISAVLMALVLIFASSWFAHLPHCVLAATIMVAVLSLFDLATLRKTLRYDRGDAIALLGTFFGVVLVGVETGIVSGVILSFAVLVWRSAHPHMAIVGRVPGSEHFRNVERYSVETLPHVLAIRVDENLFFGNATAVERALQSRLAAQPLAQHLLLIMSAVNRIDSTALEMLLSLEQRLAEQGIQLSMAEIKGPVMERLLPTALGKRLEGRIWLSAHEAFLSLAARAA